MMKQFDINGVQPEMMDVVEEFPKIFLEPSKDVLEWQAKYPENMPKTEELVNLRFGFEHGLGWKEIVRGFCKDMQEFSDKHGVQYKGGIMKEKFGTFTPQGDIEGYRKEIFDEYCDIERKWAEKSQTMCEITGKPGKLCRTRGGWRKTLCEEEMGDRYEQI